MDAMTTRLVAMGIMTWVREPKTEAPKTEAPKTTFTIRVEGGYPGLVLGLLISCFLGWCCYRGIRLVNTLLTAFYNRLPRMMRGSRYIMYK